LSESIKKYWFLIGLLLVFVVTVADASETVSSIGRWLKMHRGPDAVIVLIFFFSGLILNVRQIRSGMMDIRVIIAALIIIFLVAPLVGMLFGTFPIDTGKNAIVSGGASVGIILLLVFSFHAILLATAAILIGCLKLGKGRRESVIFMGGQKTLPLSIILQVSLFPQFGLALVVCVLHHMVHLLMDGYLVGRLRA